MRDAVENERAAGPGGMRDRMRWRLRGAWQWPTFAVATVLDAALLHWLPIAGDGTGWVPGLLLAGSLNVIAVALLGGLGGLALRRRRSDLPKVVADDYAGTALIGLVAASLLAAGLVHRPEVADRRAEMRAQARAVQRWVATFGDAVARAHVDDADTLHVDEHLFRTCVPEGVPRRRLCLIVDTAATPPRVKRDPSREPNASLNAVARHR